LSAPSHNLGVDAFVGMSGQPGVIDNTGNRSGHAASLHRNGKTLEWHRSGGRLAHLRRRTEMRSRVQKTQRAGFTSTSPWDTRADANGVCLRVAERTLVGKFDYVLSLGCLVTARGLLYRSKPSIEATNVNATVRECKPRQPGTSGRWRVRPTAPCSGGPSRPWLTDGYPSLRAKRRSTPHLQGPNPAIRRPNRASALAWPAAGQMRTDVLGRTVDPISAKGLQTSNYVEVISVDRERSSGGLLRS
jgi:hypothetical protein